MPVQAWVVGEPGPIDEGPVPRVERVGDLVPAALLAIDRGGTLSIAGIHLSDVPSLNYTDHLFQERQVRSVTANARNDGVEFLGIASRIGIRVETTPYPLGEVDRALADLAHERVNGAAVVRVGAT